MTVQTEANYLDTMKQAVIDALEDIKGFDIAVMDEIGRASCRERVCSTV